MAEINRRRLIWVAGVGFAASVVALPDATASPSLSDEPTRGFPPNVRLRGTNIVCNANPMGQSWRIYGNTVWAAMWNVWDWDNWIKPQIDDAAAIGNTVRLWGSTQAFLAGGITEDTYFSRWQQLLDYCASKALYVLPTGSDLQTDVEKLVSSAKAASHYANWANLLAEYPGVLGVDLMNEAWGGPAGSLYSRASYDWLLTVLRSCAEAVHNVALPVTVSFPLFDSSLWSWNPKGPGPGGPLLARYPVAPFFDLSDYLDIHVYAPGTPAQVASTYENTWAAGKPMIFGEFGIGANHSPAARSAFYEMVKQLVTARQDNVGAISWSCYDVNKTDNQNGLYSAPGVLRADIAKPFATFPTTR